MQQQSKFAYILNDLVRNRCRKISDGALSLYAFLLYREAIHKDERGDGTGDLAMRPRALFRHLGCSPNSITNWINELNNEWFTQDHNGNWVKVKREGEKLISCNPRDRLILINNGMHTRNKVIESSDFTRVPLIEWQNSKFTPGMRRLWITLWGFRNSKNEACYPSRNTLAKCMGTSVSTVKRRVRQLTTFGLISHKQIVRPGQFSSNSYGLRCMISDHKNLPPNEPQPHITCHEITRGVPPNDPRYTTKRPTHLPPNDRRTCHGVTHKHDFEQDSLPREIKRRNEYTTNASASHTDDSEPPLAVDHFGLTRIDCNIWRTPDGKELRGLTEYLHYISN